MKLSEVGQFPSTERTSIQGRFQFPSRRRFGSVADLPYDLTGQTLKMIKRPNIANGMGYVGLVLSLLYWFLLCLDAAKHHFEREQFMLFLNGLAYVWLPVWLLGLLLSIAAMVMGSRRWGLAAVLPLVSCWLSWSILASVPF
jgi:hypothetical protein